jgi:hypothetical protein
MKAETAAIINNFPVSAAPVGWRQGYRTKIRHEGRILVSEFLPLAKTPGCDHGFRAVFAPDANADEIIRQGWRQDAAVNKLSAHGGQMEFALCANSDEIIRQGWRQDAAVNRLSAHGGQMAFAPGANADVKNRQGWRILTHLARVLLSLTPSHKLT